jgi:hypothetical protein
VLDYSPSIGVRARREKDSAGGTVLTGEKIHEWRRSTDAEDPLMQKIH